MKKILSLMLTLTVSMLSVWAQTCPDTLRSTATVTITKQAPLIANMLPGKFTINASGDQVSFSKGNLQYLAKEDRYRFADSQTTYIGNAVGNTLSGDANRATNVNWIDLFGWATSGNPAASVGGKYQPWETEGSSHAEYGNSVTSSNTNWDPDKCDWGVVNMPGSGWRVLTKDEWYYLINTRSNAYNLVGLGTVNGVKGMILLPDGWQQINSAMAGHFNGLSVSGSGQDNFQNTIEGKSWEVLEKEGAVFLPCAGYRSNATVSQTGTQGQYWTATSKDSEIAYIVSFPYWYGREISTQGRRWGCAVRLVCDR